jgi:hypothetical protein
VTLEEVTAALVAMFTTALTVPVYDGAAVTEQIPPAYVVVGWSEDAEDSVVDLAPSPMGNRWADEAGAIQCAAYAWSGDSTLAANGVIAQALVDDCRATVQNDPTLGGVLTAGYLAWVSRVARTRSQDSGPVVKYAFTVSYTQLLTS